MKKLDKSQEKRWSELAKTLEGKRQALESAVEAFNGEVVQLWEPVKQALEELNERLQEAEEFREEIHGDMDAYFGERSEKWQEGDIGQAYQEWQSSWETSFDEVCFEQEPLEIEAPDLSETVERFGELQLSLEGE